MKLVKRSSLCWLVLLSTLFFLLPAPAQEAPKDLRDWQLICYCSGGNPDDIVRKDDNGQILFTARSGTTRERLKGDGIAFTESQIELLKDWRLLAEQGDQIKTRMPVVGPEEMTRLRALLHVQAVELGSSLQPDFKAFVAAVTQRGYADNAYSIAFSYLLDGMVWDEFEQRHLLPSMETTAEKPFWGGVLWAIYPRRDAPGTNSRSHGGWSLSVMWTQSVQPLLTPLNSSSLVDPLLNDLETRGSASDPATRNQLVALGILTAEGKRAVPVIHEVPSDSIYAVSLAISRKVATACCAPCNLQPSRRCLEATTAAWRSSSLTMSSCGNSSRTWSRPGLFALPRFSLQKRMPIPGKFTTWYLSWLSNRSDDRFASFSSLLMRLAGVGYVAAAEPLPTSGPAR